MELVDYALIQSNQTTLGNVLDLGAGDGFWLKHLMKEGKATHGYGVEVETWMGQKHKNIKNKNIDFVFIDPDQSIQKVTIQFINNLKASYNVEKHHMILYFIHLLYWFAVLVLFCCFLFANGDSFPCFDGFFTTCCISIYGGTECFFFPFANLCIKSSKEMV